MFVYTYFVTFQSGSLKFRVFIFVQQVAAHSVKEDSALSENTKLEKLVQVAFRNYKHAGSADSRYLAIKIPTIDRQILLQVDKKVALSANRKTNQARGVASSAECARKANT
jgi:hypothetical protein